MHGKDAPLDRTRQLADQCSARSLQDRGRRLWLSTLARTGALIVLVSALAIFESNHSALAANDDEPSAKDLIAGRNDLMRYVLVGPNGKKEPPDGYHLLLVLSGGDGSVEFKPFVTNIGRHALPEGYLLAQLVAPKWSDDENRIVWPTAKLGDSKAKFTTEEFIDAVVADVGSKNKLDPQHIYALGWSSGGPPVYSAAMRAKTPLTGAMVAMSVYKPELLPGPENAKGRAFYILHSPQDFIPMRFPEQARTALKTGGAQVELATYEGGHGWHGDVFGMIRKGIEYLDKRTTRTASDLSKPAK
jgi:predicted esterase